MILRSRGDDGQLVMRRPAYEPGAYTVPDRTLAGLRSMAQRQAFAEASSAPDGMLRGYTQIEAFNRDGNPWYLFQANGSEHCVEIGVNDGAMVEIVPVPPERAWEIALDRDKQFHAGIVYE
jgi:hypothetical protein